MSAPQNKITLTDALHRINTELNYAEGLLTMRPNADCSREVQAVRQMVAERASSLSNDTAASLLAECEAQLAETAKIAKSVTVHMVAHAHIDMNWMWAYDETVAVSLDTFATMLKLMEIYPNFTFSQSQASVYRIVEQYDPNMLQQIARRVKEGRWEVSSATWVEHDKNMSSGETQLRQVLYAKRCFKRLFGIGYDDIKLDFEPDTFGHSLHTPDILSSVGVNYYYHCRAYRDEKLYRWQAPDGKELLCYLEKGDWYSWEVSPGGIVDVSLREMRETGMSDVLRVYGVGDHGGGPTVRDIEAINLANSWPVFPVVKCSTYANFFAKANEARESFPLVTGEHNFVFTGCYTSQSDVKKGNRHSEKNLVQTEGFAALAHALAPEYEYPAELLGTAWEHVLFNQFHDILPGSGIVDTRRYAMGKYQEVSAVTSTTQKRALSAISSRIDTSGLLKYVPASEGVDDRALGAGVGFWQNDKGASSPGVDHNNYRIITVFNPSAVERTQVVEVVLWDMAGKGGLVAKNASGDEVALQIIEHHGGFWAHRFKIVLLEALKVPPMGYRSYVVYEDLARTDVPDGWDMRVEEPLNLSIENEMLKVTLDSQTGAISSLLLKYENLELVTEDEQTALFRVIDESSVLNGGMSSWIVGSYANIEPISGVKYTDIPRQGYERAVERFTLRKVSGALRNGLVWLGKIRGSQLLVGIHLDKGSKQVVIDCKVDWLEKGTRESFVPQLNITIPVAIKQAQHTFEVPFGAIVREPRDQDLPALRWADISGCHDATGHLFGLTVATDSKHGYRISENSVSVSLIRSSYDPDLYPEYGEHRFSLALAPHEGQCDVAAGCAVADTLDHPLVVTQNNAHTGDMSTDSALIHLNNCNIVLSSVKKPEDSDGLVIRLYEVAGCDTSAKLYVSPELAGEGASWSEVDSLERPIGDFKPVVDGIIRVNIPARAIRSIIVK